GYNAHHATALRQIVKQPQEIERILYHVHQVGRVDEMKALGIHIAETHIGDIEVAYRILRGGDVYPARGREIPVGSKIQLDPVGVKPRLGRVGRELKAKALVGQRMTAKTLLVVEKLVQNFLFFFGKRGNGYPTVLLSEGIFVGEGLFDLSQHS
ncbi:hypothetical protein LCGC14_2883030, partial [marine sediment metagenome]